MKIISSETIVRHLVEYDHEECGILKLVGMLPPNATEPARLHLTDAEIQQTKEIMDEFRAEFDVTVTTATPTKKEETP